MAGAPLARVDRDAGRAEGYDVTTPVVITNADGFEVVEAVDAAKVDPGDPIFHVHRGGLALQP